MAKAGLPQQPASGEILLEEFLKPMVLSQNALGAPVHVAPRRMQRDACSRKARHDGRYRLRLARYFACRRGVFYPGISRWDDDLYAARRGDRRAT